MKILKEITIVLYQNHEGRYFFAFGNDYYEGDKRSDIYHQIPDDKKNIVYNLLMNY